LVLRPDIIFEVRDLGVPPNSVTPFRSARTTTAGWINNAAINSFVNGVGLGGPGTISPGISITFSDMVPYYINSGAGGGETDAFLGSVWGSFDGTTRAPVVYPVYQDPRLPELSLEYLQNVVLRQSSN